MDPFFFSDDQDELQYLWGLSMDPNVDLLNAVIQHLPRPPSPVTRWSAFSKYSPGPIPAPLVSNSPSQVHDRGQNIHRQIIQLLRRIRRGKQESKGAGAGAGVSGSEKDGSRVFRHMMRERQRRERLSQSYADLYAMLSPRTKADKNSIVQTASALVRELKGVKEGLQKRNDDLMKMTAAAAAAMAEGTSARIEQKMELGGEEVITLRVENSTSAIDSVIGALRSLDRMDIKTRAIRGKFAAAAAGGMAGGVMTLETNKRSGALMEMILAVEGWRTLKLK